MRHHTWLGKSLSQGGMFSIQWLSLVTVQKSWSCKWIDQGRYVSVVENPSSHHTCFVFLLIPCYTIREYRANWHKFGEQYVGDHFAWGESIPAGPPRGDLNRRSRGLSYRGPMRYWDRCSVAIVGKKTAKAWSEAGWLLAHHMCSKISNLAKHNAQCVHHDLHLIFDWETMLKVCFDIRSSLRAMLRLE